MSRLHTEPVEVRRRDEAPEQFLWRDRLYVVREILSRWTESGQWWTATSVRSSLTGDTAPDVDRPLPTPLSTTPIPASPKWAQRAWGEPAPDVGAAVGPAGIDDGEREWWRVEAARGKCFSSGVYDLCFDWASGGWLLARVLD